MPLTTDEMIDTGIFALQKVKGAIQEDSAGGKTITKSELMEIVIQIATKLGAEVID